MQAKTNSSKIPVGISGMAKMMGMEAVEVRFFPKVDDLRQILKDYNMGYGTKQAIVKKLEALKEECIEENWDTYAEGIGKIITQFQYRY